MALDKLYGSKRFGVYYVHPKDEYFNAPPLPNSFVTESCGSQSKYPGRYYWYIMEKSDTGFFNRKFVGWAEGLEEWEKRAKKTAGMAADDDDTEEL
jgi:hypothetical protein